MTDRRDVTIAVFARTGAGKTFISHLIARLLRDSGLGEIVEISDRMYGFMGEQAPESDWGPRTREEIDARIDQILPKLQGRMRFRIVTYPTNRDGVGGSYGSQPIATPFKEPAGDQEP